MPYFLVFLLFGSYAYNEYYYPGRIEAIGRAKIRLEQELEQERTDRLEQLVEEELEK